MLYTLNKHVDNLLVKEGIKICKSDSGITGTELRKAHEFFGETIADTYKQHFSSEAVVITLLRAGFPMAYGFANKLDCTFLLYDDKKDVDFFEKNKALLQNKEVIFIDAVINSGKGILKAIELSNIPRNRIKIVTNVLCDKAIDTFKDYELFTVRVSHNSFKGQKVAKQSNGVGPDTGDRLFRTMESVEKKYKEESNYTGDKSILLEVGYGLIPLVESIYQRTLTDSIKELRKFNPDFPLVRIVDNMQFEKTSFRINNGEIHTIQFDATSDRTAIIHEIIDILQKELQAA